MYTIIALAVHVVGTVASYVCGASAAAGGIVDVGHSVLPASPGLRPWVDALTCAVPVVVGLNRHAERALVTFCIATCLRGVCIALTVLPPLLPVGAPHPAMLLVGHGYDSVFSGHAAFVASWVLCAPGRVTWTLGALHAAGLVASRMHYTVDVFLGWVLAWLIHSLYAAPPPPHPLTLRYVAGAELDDVARLRHEVYARELGQFEVRADGRLPESTAWNRVLIGAFDGGALVGYVGVTMPGGEYSLETYGLHKPRGDAYEIRALCVSRAHRRRGVAKALIHAALRFVDASGGSEVVGMARQHLVAAYAAHGMEQTGECVEVNGLWYCGVRGRPRASADLLPPGVAWELPFARGGGAPCFHGGASLAAIQPTKNISADVLDAWYDPSPAAVEAMTRHARWAMRTSPPTRCEPLVEAIAAARGLPPDAIAVGAGSSDLIFRCFTHWLRDSSRVLLVEPTYGEYGHVLRDVIGCTVDSLQLSETTGFRLDADALVDACAATRYDLVVLVNPNNPSGTHHAGLADVVGRLGTRVWIDETYVDYVAGHTLEPVAASRPDVVVCKSMSKLYALSGCRVGYVCGHPSLICGIRARTPPWIVGRAVQAAAIAAVGDVAYYAARLAETHAMRRSMERALSCIPGVEVLPGCANWTLVRLARHDVAAVVQRCARRGVYLRDTGIPGLCRIAVKREHETIVSVLRDVVTSSV